MRRRTETRRTFFSQLDFLAGRYIVRGPRFCTPIRVDLFSEISCGRGRRPVRTSIRVDCRPLAPLWGPLVFSGCVHRRDRGRGLRQSGLGLLELLGQTLDLGRGPTVLDVQHFPDLEIVLGNVALLVAPPPRRPAHRSVLGIELGGLPPDLGRPALEPAVEPRREPHPAFRADRLGGLEDLHRRLQRLRWV